MKPIFFASPAQLRAWLQKHHATAKELEVGFYKKHTGRPSLTWQQLVDEVLCFGWIDGVRHGIDGESFRQRVTPRKPTSNWSLINVNRVKALKKEGRMTPAGLKAFALRKKHKTGVYSFEQGKAAVLPPKMRKALKANAAAWAFFTGQAPWYQRVATFWVLSAKQEATRVRRFGVLVQSSEKQRRVPPLVPTKVGSAKS